MLERLGDQRPHVFRSRRGQPQEAGRRHESAYRPAPHHEVDSDQIAGPVALEAFESTHPDSLGLSSCGSTHSSPQDFDGIARSPRRSMPIFGTMRPKLIAKMMVMALMPSAIVRRRSPNVVCEPPASCRRPLAIRNRKTPGIIDTTEAKPMAAKGMCERRATGVRISPTIRQATKAPIAAALEPSTASDHHLRA